MRRFATLALVALAFTGAAASAQPDVPAKPEARMAVRMAAPAPAPAFAGHWRGTFKAGDEDAELTLHIAPADSGGFALTYDFPMQGQVGAASPATFAGNRIAIAPAPGVSYEGTLSAAGDAITGKLTTPGPMIGGGEPSETPLNFARTAAPPPPPAEIADPGGRTGDYAGAISMGAMSLEMTLRLRRTAEGYVATLDVPMQNASGLRATSAAVEGERLAVVFPFPGDPTFTGTFTATGLDGTWTQGGRELPLVLTRAAE